MYVILAGFIDVIIGS